MEILNLQETSVKDGVTAAAAVLRSGGLVVYPTETTYGIGADATNPEAIQKLLQYKTQREDKPFSIVVTGRPMAEEYADLNATALQVYDTFLPGPVTVVSVGKHTLAPRVESIQGTIGIRIPAHEIPIALVQELGHPITATGANASHQKRPYAIQDILNNTTLKQQSLIDLVLDVGTLPPNEPSTVVDTTLDTYQVLRQGTIDFPEKQRWETHSPEETIALGKRIIQRVKNLWGHQPVILALEGEMGAGKTHFTKGVAAGLGITQRVKSPSYTLVEEYEFMAEGKLRPFFHVDAWRIEHAEEMVHLGLEKAFQDNGVIVFEWANSQLEWLQQWRNQAKILWLRLHTDSIDPSHRTISLAEEAS